MTTDAHTEAATEMMRELFRLLRNEYRAIVARFDATDPNGIAAKMTRSWAVTVAGCRERNASPEEFCDAVEETLDRWIDCLADWASDIEIY